MAVKRQVLITVTAFCWLIILSALLGGVTSSSTIDNQPVTAQTRDVLNHDDQHEEQHQQQHLPSMPSPTSGWNEMISDELSPPAMPLMGFHLSKRAPNGFIGMRGKKQNMYGDGDVDNDIDEELIKDDFSAPLPPWLWGSNNNIPLSLLPALENAANVARHKKSPSAFYGVRGKKYGAGAELTRISHMLQQLEQEHLREQLLQQFIDRVASAQTQDNEIVVGSNEKRAPIGFTGVRGKRPNVIREDVDGRSDFNHNSNQYNDLNSDILLHTNDDDDDVGAGDVDDIDVATADAADGGDNDLLMLHKRGPSNAFLGVRGKKSVDDHQYNKRSSNERSSSSPSSTQWRWRQQAYGGGVGIGLRSGGKQQRFVDFGSKFVAVRGKKGSIGRSGSVGNIRSALSGGGAWSTGGSNTLQHASTSEMWHHGAYDAPSHTWLPAAMSLVALGSPSSSSSELRYNSDDKRAPSGFVGMRGKRDVATTLTTNNNIETGAAIPTNPRQPLKMLEMPKLNM